MKDDLLQISSVLVEEESPNELLGGEGHDLLLMVAAIVPPLELPPWRFAANIVCQDSDACFAGVVSIALGMLPVLCIRETCSRDRFARYAIQGWTPI